jgi:hypothetical protein
MPDGGRDDVIVVLEVIAELLEPTESASEVIRDARFLSNDKRLGHFFLSESLRFWGKTVGTLSNCRAQIAISGRATVFTSVVILRGREGKRDRLTWQIGFKARLFTHSIRAL